VKRETCNVKLRMGLRYVRGLREEAGRALVAARQRAPFTSIDDLIRRVPQLRKSDLVMQASVGALNSVASSQWPVVSTNGLATGDRLLATHRRSALWHVEAAGQPRGPLLDELDTADATSPLQKMTDDERLVADYHGTGLTIGPHPMAYRREEMRARKILSAEEIKRLPNGKYARGAGCVICRQRPGTASGLIFLSLEDETGITNVIVRPELYEREKMTVLGARFVWVEGKVQNVDKIVHIQAEKIVPLTRLHPSPPAREFDHGDSVYLQNEHEDATKLQERLEASIQSHDFH